MKSALDTPFVFLPTLEQFNTFMANRPQPGLVLSSTHLGRMAAAIRDSERVLEIYTELCNKSNQLLDSLVAEYQLVGSRLLRQSQKTLLTTTTLAGLYLINGDERYAERARRELLAAAQFPDWNPSHFLDTAEMTAALSFGYDWLYTFLSHKDKDVIADAILQKGLNPGRMAYQLHHKWTYVKHNWNHVCNGGMILGALAIAKRDIDLAYDIFLSGCSSLQVGLSSFSPDGGWDEGPSYWNYATRYVAFCLGAMQSLFNTDFGLSQAAGLHCTGLFRLHCVGPLGKVFNYSDAFERAKEAPQMFWLASNFSTPVYASSELQRPGENAEIFHLIWHTDTSKVAALSDLPRHVYFRGCNVAFLRSSWNNPAAYFVGFKGGNNRANHCHLDLGSFVFDALGHRWVSDLGPDDYNLPDYFASRRYAYYRTRSEAHNVITLSGSNQVLDAVAPISDFQSYSDWACVEVDLTQAYAPHLLYARRGIALFDDGELIVHDYWHSDGKVNVIWTIHTAASINICRSSAILSLPGQQMEVRVLAPDGVCFYTLPDTVLPPESQQPHITRLCLQIPCSGPGQLLVSFAPLGKKPRRSSPFLCNSSGLGVLGLRDEHEPAG